MTDGPLASPRAASSSSSSSASSRGHNRWLRAVDFSRPTKFGPDDEQRMRRLHESYCRLTATRMAGQLRVPLELEFLDTSQRTWRDAYGMVPREAACALLDLQPYGTTCLMAVEMPLLLLAVDKLLGSDDDEPLERKLTSIDTKLVRRVLGELANTLTLTWQELGDVEFALAGVESEADATQAVPASEPTLVVGMEARLGSVSSAVVLLLPHASVQPLLHEIGHHPRAGAAADPDALEVLRRRVGEADIEIRAELGSTQMGLNEVLALRPGDSIRLSGPPPGEADLVVDDISVYRTRAGHHGQQRAVQIESRTGETTS